MPGILPMKVIKVGNSAQSRIAQACDRCRSKKIRCDGVRPTCSQCANVGFECRTSDKLSRRAFPRGYTESLEERVRQLEAEVRELKDLLDEKDEKIDMLAAMHGNSHRQQSAVSSINSSPELSVESREDTFRVQADSLILGVEHSDSYLMGPSSGRTLITSLKKRLQELGKPCTDFNPDAFLHVQGCPPLPAQEANQASSCIPPRIFSDRCVNVFFQEWAPLFPVLHKPTFLRSYQEFAASPDKVRCKHKLAQLYLVFSIGGLSFESPDYSQVALCEKQWTKAIEALQFDDTISTLQCYILALLYSSIRADNKCIQHFKSNAVGLSHRLGLHQSQKRFSFGILTLETRKRVFWTLYTLDCFTAASLGLPRLLQDDSIEAEFPSDMDDEYITEKGFQPTLPGECTRLSSALALFRAARILARVLEKVYPASASYDISLGQMMMLESELDGWLAELPRRLRLDFEQDKPSNNMTSDRSPLLALAYYYIRTLIYRPAVGSSLGANAAPALLSISDSSKHIIQISQLLRERSMCFSFCVNKFDLLAVCAMTLLYQLVDLRQGSKLTRDIERLVGAVIKAGCSAQAPGSAHLVRVSQLLIRLQTDDVDCAASQWHKNYAAASLGPVPTSAMPRNNGTGAMANGVPGDSSDSRETGRQGDGGRCMPMGMGSGPGPSSMCHVGSQSSTDSLGVEAKQQQEYASQMQRHDSRGNQRRMASRSIPNLDYLSLGSTSLQPGAMSRMQAAGSAASQGGQVLSSDTCGGKMARSPTAEWETLLGCMDSGMNNVYDAIYGGSSLTSEGALRGSGTNQGWSPDSWDLSGISIGDYRSDGGAAQSVPSMSEESLSSGEEAASSEMGMRVEGVDYHSHMRSDMQSKAFAVEGFAL
ncbi:hypothetical protein CDD81_1998 [Ophiocordyceps australis]|uniref:Zn(2)-C6 fungal-type domain-containing protein n=1 Tax=Ophiocordyceps australis TaxID=1399860 RepID=A0A2C5YD71_9HYPO|nr:hypothetical protein CDD81_1998 [Ophiocordyceps australis]